MTLEMFDPSSSRSNVLSLTRVCVDIDEAHDTDNADGDNRKSNSDTASKTSPEKKLLLDYLTEILRLQIFLA